MNVRLGLFLATATTLLVSLTACGDADSSSLLARRVEASFDVTAKVTYEVTYDPNGMGDLDPVTATITQGAWGRRMDSHGSRENMTFSGTFLDLGDEQYICSRATGLEPEGLGKDQFQALEDGICYSDDLSLFGGDDGLGGIFDFTLSFRQTLKEHDEEMEWEAGPSRTIAGIDADCYQVTFTDPETGESDDTNICFSDDDILLSMEVLSPGASGSFLALEVDRSVEENDFALPYPLVDWPY